MSRANKTKSAPLDRSPLVSDIGDVADPAGGTPVAKHSASTDPDELAEHARQTREALGDTVSALAAKADVKERVSDSVASAKAKTAELTSDAMAKTAELTSEVKAKTAEFGSNVAAEASGTAEEIAEMAGRMAERVRRNPLPWVAGAIAALVAVVMAARGRRR